MLNAIKNVVAVIQLIKEEKNFNLPTAIREVQGSAVHTTVKIYYIIEALQQIYDIVSKEDNNDEEKIREIKKVLNLKENNQEENE